MDLKLEETLEFFMPDLETFDFSIETLAQRVEEMEGRPIRFVPADLAVSLFGARVMVAAADKVIEYIVYNEKLPAFHRDHVKLHELAHGMLGHPTLILRDHELDWLLQNAPEAASLWPQISCRASDPRQFSGERLVRDQEAERLTRVIYQRILLSRQKKGWRRNSSQDDLDGFFRHLGID
jgi:hypothetical protein